MPIFSREQPPVEIPAEVRSRAARLADGEIITTWKYDEPSNGAIVVRSQDIEPYLERNKKLYTADDGYSPSRELRRVASIPAVIVEQWMREGVSIFDHNAQDEIRRRLNDSENLFLRTAPGRL